MRELNRFLRAIGEDEFPHPRSIWYRWWEWHLLHPLVELQLYALVMNARRKGFAHYGLKAVWEVLRWHFAVEKPKSSSAPTPTPRATPDISCGGAQSSTGSSSPRS